MLIEQINNSINRINKTMARIDLANYAEKQAQIDHEYQGIVNNLYSITEKIYMTCQATGFRPDAEVIDDLSEVSQKLSGFTMENLVTDPVVDSAKKNLGQIQSLLEKNWSNYYNKKIGSTIAVLRLLNRINSFEIQPCINKIEKGRKWNSDLSSKYAMMDGFQEAKDIISKLKINSDIIQFLLAVNANTATLRDVNDNVMRWLQKEQMDDKILLSFGSVAYTDNSGYSRYKRY